MSTETYKGLQYTWKKPTFAGRVREKIHELSESKGSFTIDEIGLELDLISHSERKLLYVTVSDMRRRGEVEIVKEAQKQGTVIRTFRLVTPRDDRSFQKQEIIWRLIRSRKKGPVNDLVELSGAKRSYVDEYLALLKKRGIIRIQTRFWEDSTPERIFVLVKDPVIMPENDEKAERLRAIRAHKKALNALDNAYDGLTVARMAVSEAMNFISDDDDR
jgi:hypothetical protein